MFESFIEILLHFSQKLGHWGVFLLMAVESTFVPLPSEIVIPPAAFLAQQGKLNIYLVIVAGILGSIAGALVNYCLARYLGRKIGYRLVNHKFAKLFLLSEEKLLKSERYFLRYGNVATFIGRLIPGIRHLISIPAGFVKMPLRGFLLYTFLGSGIWVLILALQGYLIGAYKKFFVGYVGEIILGFVFIALTVWILGRYLKKRQNRSS